MLATVGEPGCSLSGHLSGHWEGGPWAPLQTLQSPLTPFALAPVTIPLPGWELGAQEATQPNLQMGIEVGVRLAPVP